MIDELALAPHCTPLCDHVEADNPLWFGIMAPDVAGPGATSWYLPSWLIAREEGLVEADPVPTHVASFTHDAAESVEPSTQPDAAEVVAAIESALKLK